MVAMDSGDVVLMGEVGGEVEEEDDFEEGVRRSLSLPRNIPSPEPILAFRFSSNSAAGVAARSSSLALTSVTATDVGVPTPLPSINPSSTSLATKRAAPGSDSTTPCLTSTASPTPPADPTALPCSSSSRRKAVTAVQPEWVFSVAARRESFVSTLWKVWLRRSGMGVVGDVRRASRRCYKEMTTINIGCGFQRRAWWSTDFVKVLATPFGGVFAGVTIEYGEVTLTSNSAKVVNEGMRAGEWRVSAEECDGATGEAGGGEGGGASMMQN